MLKIETNTRNSSKQRILDNPKLVNFNVSIPYTQFKTSLDTIYTQKKPWPTPTSSDFYNQNNVQDVAQPPSLPPPSPPLPSRLGRWRARIRAWVRGSFQYGGTRVTHEGSSVVQSLAQFSRGQIQSAR